jgi:hypothetical protein
LEHDKIRREARRSLQRSLPLCSTEEILAVSGKLAALLLLSGKAFFKSDAAPLETPENCINLEDILEHGNAPLTLSENAV